MATASLKWSATREPKSQNLEVFRSPLRNRGGGGGGGTLTAVPARLDAVVDIGLILPLHTPQYQARQITVEIFLQLSHLRGMSRLGAADHDCLLRGRLASNCTTGRSGTEALDSRGGAARIGQLGLQGFVLILCFGEGV